jgi:D-glycero-alpha-D-manno-heptose-7-phosphate kinase
VLGHYDCRDGLEVHHDGDLPARAGLGSSSSFTVGLINAIQALRGRYVSKEDLAAQAIHVEQQVIRETVGSQDQVSAAFGGLNRIEFRQNGSFDVAPIVLPVERQEELQRHMMLCFTGLSRIASEVAQSTIENMDRREKELTRLRGLVEQAISVLQSSAPIEEFGELLHEAWMTKRQLSDRVSTGEIDQLYETARGMGAIGGKLLGAGGGGFFLLLARPERQREIREKLARLVHVPFRFESAGSRVVLYQPSGL